MRVLLSTYGSRGDVEPMAGLALALQALGVEAVVSAPPDQEFIDLLERAGVAFVPAFMGVRDWIATAGKPPVDLPRRAAEMAHGQFPVIDAAAESCDLIVATGLMPSAAAARAVAERRGVAYTHATFCPLFLPSEHHAPFPYPGQPHPPGVTDPRALWDHNIEAMNALFGAAVNGLRTSVGLPRADNVRDHVFTERPLLASDPALWPWAPTDLCDAVQTGAWILPDHRPLPDGLETFLEAGAPPVYVGFGSMGMAASRDAARAAVEAARSHGRRVVLAQGWASIRSTTARTASPSATSTSRPCSRASPRPSTTAEPARPPPPPAPARRRSSCPRSSTSPSGPSGSRPWAPGWRTTGRRRRPHR